MTRATGELFDLGYQRYRGPREGRMRARKAVFVNGLRTTLGLGRGAVAKILPMLLFASAMAPAVILALIASVAEEVEVDIPGHSDYYQVVSIILILFSAVIAPELLCPDRRDGVISLYLVRPLTSTDYLAGRWLAFFAITLLIVYSGQVVLMVGLILSASEPLDYLRDNWLDIPRFLAAGVLVAMFTTTLPLAVSAFTTRRAYAAAFVIGLFVISAAVGGILTGCHEDDGRHPGGQCEPVTGEAARWFGLADIGRVPIHLSDMIFDVENTSNLSSQVDKLPNVVPVGWYLLLTAGPAFALWSRYRRITV